MGAARERRRARARSRAICPQGDPVVLGVYLWSLVHGLAELWRTGPLSLMPQAAGGLEPMARQVLMAALGRWRPLPRRIGLRGSPADGVVAM